MSVGAQTPHAGLVEGARGFVLLAVAGAVVWTRDTQALAGLLALATVWITCIWLIRTRVRPAVTTVFESVLVAAVAGLHYDSSPALLAALTVPPFVHGLARGLRGTCEALVLQVLTLVGLVVLETGSPDASQAADLFTWLVTGLGLGLVASVFMGTTNEDDTGRAYAEARELLRELNVLSSRLDGGLDPMSMAGGLLEEVSSELPLVRCVLHVERDGELLAIAERTTSAAPTPDEPGEAQRGSSLALQAWEEGRTLVRGPSFAFVVTSGDAPIAVVSGELAPGLQSDADAISAELDDVASNLIPSALRLDTAQLFVAFRDAAMSEERRRLAREMHDGVAQDIASMGYVVDALISTATPVQEQPLQQLRQMITGVVAEVRRSVMTLRTQAGSSESLGAAIATLARHLSDVSGHPITVTVDERTSRLRHEVEAELLRIAQEAMNNAVRHSRATMIDVHCRVQAPHAEIVVQDDGCGLQAGRRDSHGLSIMRERASLIGGVLDVSSSPDHGTRVSVRIGHPDPVAAQNRLSPFKENPA